MPRARGGGAAVSYTEHLSDSDSDADMLAAPGPAPPAPPPAKRAGRPKGTGKKATSTRVREVPETQLVDGADDADDLDSLSAPAASSKPAPTKPPAKRARTQSKSENTKSRGRDHVDTQDDLAGAEGDAQASSNLSRTAASKKKAPRPAKREVIPDTQPEPMELEKPDAKDIDAPEELEDVAIPEAKTKSRKGAAPRQQNAARKTAASGPEADKEGEAVLRQQLDQMTKRFDALEVRYRDLQEVGVEEAGRNFEALRKQSDERSKAADKLIAKLKADMASSSSQAGEIAKLETELKTARDTNSAAAADNKKLQSTLQTAQNEIKALQAKLAATRVPSEQANGRTVPGSAVKGPAARQAANADAQLDIAKRALKEDLYADLSGLIINNVKRREETGEDVYDCIQTGRNGTLQFHLSIPNPAPDGEAYDDVEIGYEPFLDEKRDRDIIEVLPEFAREEICFQRAQAAKFYAQIREAIQKRVHVDDVMDEGGDET